MTTIAFIKLPFAVRLATFTAPFFAWLMIAEWVIDRHGLDNLLPYYRVANFCVWDAAVAATLGMIWWHVHRNNQASERVIR